jgi:site-specific recombinase XerD
VSGLQPAIVGKEAITKISEVNLPALKRLQDLIMLKGYSKNTLETYSREFSQLLYMLKNVNVDTLTAERLRSYFLYCHSTLKLSENEMHSRINAVKFYFEQVLKRDKMFF